MYYTILDWDANERYEMRSFAILAFLGACVLPAFGELSSLSSLISRIPGTVRRSSFGEECNKTLKCDSRAWLGCYNGICDCVKQDEMIFEDIAKKCVSKSGERCTFALDDLEDNNFIFEVTACVSGANCSPEGMCLCGNKFYEDLNGTCSPAFGHMESCESEAQCSAYQGLHCYSGKCKCNDSVSIYSDSVGTGNGTVNNQPQCVGLGGHPCISSKCTEHATCSNKGCICNEEFYLNPTTGLCLPRIERTGSCVASFQCEKIPGQVLACSDGVCDCDPSVSVYSTAQASIHYAERNGYTGSHYDGQSFDQNRNFHGYRGSEITQCVGLASSHCIDRLCTKNAFCSFPTMRIDITQQSICKCRPEYMETKSHTCATGYGTSCSSSSTCMDGLVCITQEGVCRCQYDTQTYDSSRRTCVSLVGGPCEDSSSCEQQNAECVISRNGLGAVGGHCACKKGYVENMNGKCEAGHGTSCSSNQHCDRIPSLECISGKCRCRQFSEFNSTLRKCLSLVGGRCNVSEVNECVENSNCKRSTPRQLPGHCACNQGFEETSIYTCGPVENGEDEL